VSKTKRQITEDDSTFAPGDVVSGLQPGELVEMRSVTPSGAERLVEGVALAFRMLVRRLLAAGELAAVERVRGRLEISENVEDAWGLLSELGEQLPWHLSAEAWTEHPASVTYYSTVAPVAFDRDPKTKDRIAYHRQSAEIVGNACTGGGLPQPREAIAAPFSAHLEVPPANVSPPSRRKSGSKLSHGLLVSTFDQHPRSPMMLGALRYRGYAVCRRLVQTLTITGQRYNALTEVRCERIGCFRRLGRHRPASTVVDFGPSVLHTRDAAHPRSQR